MTSLQGANLFLGVVILLSVIMFIPLAIAMAAVWVDMMQDAIAFWNK